MRDRERRDRERAKLQRFLVIDDLQFGLLKHVGFLQLAFDHADGQRRAINGRVHLPQQIRQSADMVHVTVRQHNAAQPVLVLDHVIELGQNQVDAVHIAFGEHYPAVDDDHVAAVFENSHVLANFPQAAQGNDT